MKSTKAKVLVCILACFLVSMFALAGCSSSGGSKDSEESQTAESTESSQESTDSSEPIQLTVKVPTLELTAIDDPEVTTSYQFLVKAAEAFEASYPEPIDIKVEEFEITRETEAITESFDTEDAPDVLYEGYFNMASYIHTGRMVPLDDIITDEISADIDESTLNLGKAGGKTYMMPFVDLQNILSFNKDLFRQAGLDEFVLDEDVIQSWTPEQWEKVLSTLRKKLPKDVYPLMMYAKNDQGDTHTMLMIRSQGSDFYDENGRFNLETPEGIAGLQWIADNNEKGYYPPNAENLEIIDNQELFENGKLGIYLYNPAFAATFGKTMDLGFVNFPSLDGKGHASDFVTGFGVFDNGDPRTVQAAKDFVKFIYENEEWLNYSAGDIPVSHKVMESHKDQIPMMEEFVNNEKNSVNYTGNNPNWRGVRDVFYLGIQDLLRGTSAPKEVAAAIDKDCNAAIEEGYETSTLHE